MFSIRHDVEKIGKSGVDVQIVEDSTYAKMLDLFYIAVDKDDAGFGPHAINDGFWEAWITLWMWNAVKSADKVLDIGANHGYYSLMLAAKGCNVVAMEPQKKLADLITMASDKNKFNIEVMEVAASDEDGVTKMIVPIHHGMNATITKPGYMPDGFEEIDVQTVRLDNLEKFDFIKIDAEGGEEKIWNGMQEYLNKYPDTLILMEWRYDRYENPEVFAEKMFDRCSVTSVDFEGGEQNIDLEKLYTKKNEDWMLVLRRKA